MECLRTDKEDLTAIIELRFGVIPPEVQKRIDWFPHREMIERMIVVAANAATWETMLEELFEDRESFRIVGEQFNPTGR